MENTIHIPLIARYSGRPQDLTSEHVLALEGTHYRFGVGAVPRGYDARKTHGGPMVPGPWAYTYGKCSVIDCHGGTGREIAENKAANREHTVRAGSLVEIDGVIYRVRVERREYLELDPV